jgi:alpha-1,3-rhamnosyl/mannosyltransferase
LDHPEWYSPDIVEIHEEKNRQAASSAQGIIAVSEFTKERFLYWFPEVDPARVHAVSNGVSTDFSVAPPAQVGTVLKKHGLSPPYLLFVGTREKRKNLMGLIEIFRRVAGERREVQLALVGMRPWMEGRDIHGVGRWVGLELEEEVKKWGLGSRVKVLGTLPRRELVSVYSGAAALLFPSLYEGFGFPALEAMACGAPVVASSRTALPEVVGDAGILADPEDADAFAEMTLRLLGDPDLSGELRSRGLKRARRFSWVATGRETMKVYESILQGATH